MLISILTPVFNRSHLLNNLYSSLINQTLHDFEWVIIDDGSTDDLSLSVGDYDNPFFPVQYIYKENGGKHSALNLGFDNCNGEWVFIVDSDDFIINNAIEKILSQIISNEHVPDAFVFLRANRDLKVMGQPHDASNIKMHSNTLAGMKGDKAYVIKKATLEKFKFPVYSDERFVTESFLWNKIFDIGTGVALGINEAIYIGEYLPGGLSDNYLNLLKDSPKGTIDFVISNLNLNSKGLNIIKQAAYHFVPIFSIYNLKKVLENIDYSTSVKFLMVFLIMKIKLTWKKYDT